MKGDCMRLLVLLAIVFISVSLMAQTLPSVCRIDQIADYTIQEGPGHSFSVYGTMYLCNYSGNLLNNIQKYTANYYEPPDKENRYIDHWWVLENTWPSDSEYWIYDDGFEIRQLVIGSPVTYRQTRYDDNGYMLRDMLSTGLEFNFSYSTTMKLLEKNARYSPTSFERWTYDYDSLDRRITTIKSTSMDSLNWTLEKKTEYFYTQVAQSEGFNPEKYENYLEMIKEVPYVSNSHRLSHYINWDYFEGEWVNPDTIEAYDTGSYYYDEFNQADFDSHGLYLGYISVYGGGYYEYHRVRWYLGESDSEDELVQEPEIKLNCYPNPFSSSSTISFILPKSENVKLYVYNLKGQVIRRLCDESKALGEHSILWDGLDESGKQVSAGVYIVRINSGKHTSTKKITMF